MPMPATVLPPPVAAPSDLGRPGGVDQLRSLLAGVRRQARRWVWIESVAWLALAAVLIFWATLAFDWCVEPPAWVRATALAVGVAVLLWIAATRLVGRLLAPLTDDALALVVERTHPAFRDSLSTAIELARRPRPDVDADLAARTTADAVAMLGDVRADAIFRRRSLGLTAFAAVAAAATVTGLAVASPATVGLWARRMTGLGDEPWPRWVSLDVEGFRDGVRTVARGSDVDVVVRARAANGPPEVVDLRVAGPGGWQSVRMGRRGGLTESGQTYGHVLDDVSVDTDLEVRGGDARVRGLRLRVVDAPALASLNVDYDLPAYLGGGPRRGAAARRLAVPRGSRVRLVFTATKPLAAASLLAAAGAGEDERLIAELGPTDGGDVRSLAATIESLDADTTLLLRLSDTDGLENRDPIEVVLESVADEPPRVAVALRGISTAVTPRARLLVEGTLADDHGLAAAEVLLGGGADERRVPLARVRGGEPVVEWPATKPEAVPLEPLGLAVGTRLAVAIEARDGCGLAGGPNVARGEAWMLDVVTPEALRALLEAREIMLRRRFETAIADLARARDRLAEPVAAAGATPPAETAVTPAERCAEAATRAAGETGEIATAFGLIRLELDNNAVLTPEIDTRLGAQIAKPLEALAADDLPSLARECRGREPVAATLVRRTDEVLARMRAVLARMVELESFNEVLERLRGVIRAQEEIRRETLERQKKRGREALESP